MRTSVQFLHARFVRAFGETKREQPVSISELLLAGRELSFVFPEPYLRFARAHGAVYTPGILRRIMTVGLDHPDLRRFLLPREILAATRTLQRAGDFPNLVAFAADCMGNPLCFERRAEGAEPSPIYFVGHEATEAVEVEPGFDALLEWYVLNLSPGEGAGEE